MILVLLRGVAWTYYFLPYRARQALGGVLGFVFRALGIRRNIVDQNLTLAFPGKEAATRKKRKTLEKAAYRHLGDLALEILMLLGPLSRFCRRFARLEGLHHWQEAKKHGKGVIFLSSHVGNWEVMAATGAIRGGIDLMIVTKQLKPRWLHDAIENGRRSCGVLATYEPRTFRDVLMHLKGNGTVGFVLDQYAGPPVGVRVPFFGVPVGTNSVVAMLARRTGAPVLPVMNYRAGDGRFVVEIQSPLAWEKSDASDARSEIASNTARYAHVLEEHVYSYPDQWLWIHRRFKGDLSPLRKGEWSEVRGRE